MSEWLLSKKQEIKNVGKDVEKKKKKIPVHPWYSHCGKQYGDSPTIKNRTTIFHEKKKSKILSFVITCMELENIMLSEISQAEKDLYMILIISGI